MHASIVERAFADHYKRHERTQIGEKSYLCKYSEKCFSRSSMYKRHEGKHGIHSSLKENHHNQCFKLKGHL